MIAALMLLASMAQPQFEAASIKPANPSVPRPGRLMTVSVTTTLGRLTARSITLKDLIRDAYSVEDYQISGGPAWIASTRFAIEARADGRADRAQLLQMLQGLLAARFALTVHRETRELSVYALVPMKGGPNLLTLKPGQEDQRAPVNRMRFRDVSYLARYLTRLGADRPVIDRTGLTGNYLLELDLERITRDLDPPSNEAIYGATVAALPDQLGLRLTPTKASVEMLVIDHAEKGGSE